MNPATESGLRSAGAAPQVARRFSGGAWIRRTIVAALVLAALTILWRESRAVDLERHEAILDSMRRLSVLDNSLNEQALKARFGLLTSYDSLAETSQAITRSGAELAFNAFDLSAEQEAGLNAERNEFVATALQKTNLLEEFKSTNAALGNSLRFLPIAVRRASEEVTAGGVRSDFEPVLEATLRDSLIFAVRADAQLPEIIQAHLDDLAALSATAPPEITDANKIVAAHANTIVRLRKSADDDLARLLALPTATRGQDMLQAYSALHAAALARADRFRLVLYLVSIGLAIYCAWAVIKIGQSALALRRANETLEQRVEARTRDLRSTTVQLEKEVAERRAAEARLAHDATHDSLTSLPNRAELLRRLQGSIDRARSKADHGYALLFLDLDNFKHVNDGLGHAAGDDLLIQVSQRLVSASRGVCPGTATQAVTARLGGDEFVVLLDDLATPQQAIDAADAIKRELAQPFVLENQPVVVSSSVGVVTGSADDTPAGLLRDADIAMYGAKTNGKSNHMVFDQAMRNAVNDRLTLENDLRLAIDRGELELHYQPIVRFESGVICGFEALARWNHPTRGRLAPDCFIPIAEETGLIIPLGLWAIEEACRAMQRINCRHAPGGDPDSLLTFSVNVSRKQLLSPVFVENLRDILTRTNTDGRLLKFEITESTVMKDPKRVTDVLQHMSELGIEFYMDDFGTGHSSLSCLHQFPIHVLKIDRSFITALSLNRSYTAVVHSVITLAHNIGVKVTAEGLETDEQVSQLIAMDCDFGQGYFFSRPIPESEIPALLARRIGERPSQTNLAA